MAFARLLQSLNLLSAAAPKLRIQDALVVALRVKVARTLSQYQQPLALLELDRAP
jgi:hypothetical protein